MTFLGRGATDFIGDLGVKSTATAIGEGFFHAAILAGMEGEDGHASAGAQAGGQMAQERIERRELVIDGDAQRLKDAAHGEIQIGFANLWQRGADGVGKLAGGGERFSSENGGKFIRARFIGILLEQTGKGCGVDFLQEGGSGLAALRIHAHVERAIVLDGKTAHRVIDLHGGNAEVGEDEIGAGELAGGEGLGQAREIGAMGGENFRAESQRAEAGFSFWKFDGIGVQAN